MFWISLGIDVQITFGWRGTRYTRPSSNALGHAIAKGYLMGPEHPSPSWLSYEVDQSCQSGEVIGSIIGRTPDFIVLVTNLSKVRYEYDDNKLAIYRPIFDECNNICQQIEDIRNAKAFKKASLTAAHALYKALMDADSDNPLVHFHEVRDFLEIRRTNQIRLHYLLVAIPSSLAIASIGIYLKSKYGVDKPDMAHISLGISGGALGVIISVLQRSGSIPVNPHSSFPDIVLQSLTKVLLGAIFGAISAVAVKAEIVMAAFKSNVYAVYLFAIMSGFSERFIPELLQSIEKQESKIRKPNNSIKGTT